MSHFRISAALAAFIASVSIQPVQASGALAHIGIILDGQTLYAPGSWDGSHYGQCSAVFPTHSEQAAVDYWIEYRLPDDTFLGAENPQYGAMYEQQWATGTYASNTTILEGPSNDEVVVDHALLAAGSAAAGEIAEAAASQLRGYIPTRYTGWINPTVISKTLQWSGSLKHVVGRMSAF